jgi:hypothetical protein
MKLGKRSGIIMNNDKVNTACMISSYAGAIKLKLYVMCIGGN